MACDVIKIVTLDADEVVSIVTQGPQGPSGAEAATLTTVGDILYRDTLAPERLPIGEPGQVLKVNSTATAPEWAEADAGVTSWNDLEDKPSTFPPDTHASTHATAGSDPLTPADIGAVADTDARLSDSRDPNAHAASHLPEGDDELFDQSLNADDDVGFNSVSVLGGDLQIGLIDNSTKISGFGRELDFENGSIDGFGGNFQDDLFTIFENSDPSRKAAFDVIGISEETTRTFSFPDKDGTLATTDDIPTELTDLAATGIAAGKILAADGDDGAEWVDAPSGGGIASDTTGITGASAISNIVAISQDDYDDIVSPDASTLYIIIP